MKDCDALNSLSLPRRDRLLLGLAAGLLVLCLLFGGWDRPGIFSDAVLQLAAVPLLLVALWQLHGSAQSVGFALAFCLIVVVVPLVQLVPLPPQIWTALPLRDLAEQALALAGQDPGWRPLSLTPHATWLSLLSLIPPLALFLATLLLSWRARRGLVLIVLGIGVVSCFLGLLQVAQGPDGWLKGLGLASAGSAEGFFVNRNLFAAFLYSVLVFAAAFAIDSTKNFAMGSAAETRTLVAVVASFTVIVAVLAAQMMARSRGGLGLSIVALIGIAALANGDDRDRAAVGANRLIGGAVALVLLFSLQFALYRVMERFATDPLEDARVALARNTWDAAQALMPFGSGLGSFVPVYQFFEKPSDALVDTYVNRAHNDVLEVWLETGVVGLALMALLVLWVGVRFWQVWRTDEPGASPLDRLLVRAASLVIVLLLAHSLVDYPLRTTAMMAVFALSCGLLFEPVGSETRHGANEADAEAGYGQPNTQSQRGGTPRSAPVRHDRREGAERREPGLAPLGPRPGGPGVESDSPSPPEASVREVWPWPEDRPQSEPHRSAGAPPASPHPKAEVADPTKTRTGQERWGEGIEWPEAWRKPSDPKKGRAKDDPDTT